MIRFGFIGCGEISRLHADAVLALQHSICGVSARPGSNRLVDFSHRYNIPNLFYDWRKMIEEQKPDALVVAVTWDQTEKIIEEVINYGIPCLVEKPVALNSQVLQKIICNTSEFHDRVIIGYNRRFYDFIPRVRQAVAEQKLISVELNFPEPADYLINIKSPPIARYILLYMSSHWLDLLISLIGELKVEWMSKRYNKQAGYVESYNGILRAIKYNIPVHLQANFNTPSNTSMVFNFQDSIYKLCPIEQLTIARGMDIVEPVTKGSVRTYIPRIEGTFYTDATYKPGFLNQMKYFIEACVLKNRPNEQGCSLKDALAVTNICEEIDQEAILG